MEIVVPLDKNKRKFGVFKRLENRGLEPYYISLTTETKGKNQKHIERTGFFVTAQGMSEFITKILMSDDQIRYFFFKSAFGVKHRVAIDETMEFILKVYDSLSNNALNVLGTQYKKEIKEHKDRIQTLFALVKLCKEFEGEVHVK